MGKPTKSLFILMAVIAVSFTTGTVIAQTINLGSTANDPELTLDSASGGSGEYIIKVNDGTGDFQIFDQANTKSAMVIKSNGNVGVGADTNPPQDFTIGCTTGVCNIQTRAFDGEAKNTVKTLNGTGDAIFKLEDANWDSTNSIRFELRTDDSGKMQFVDRTGMGNPMNVIFEILLDGPNRGQTQFFDKVVDSSGTCVINC